MRARARPIVRRIWHRHSTVVLRSFDRSCVVLRSLRSIVTRDSLTHRFSGQRFPAKHWPENEPVRSYVAGYMKISNHFDKIADSGSFQCSTDIHHGGSREDTACDDARRTEKKRHTCVFSFSNSAWTKKIRGRPATSVTTQLSVAVHTCMHVLRLAGGVVCRLLSHCTYRKLLVFARCHYQLCQSLLNCSFLQISLCIEGFLGRCSSAGTASIVTD